MLYTSYYANPLLDDSKALLVRISNSAPKDYPVHDVLREAIPTWETIVAPFKEGTLTETDYVLRYRRLLDSREFAIRLMMDTISERARDLGWDKIVFLCYEKPGKFCHRHIFAQWLTEKLDVAVEEYENPGSVEPGLF